MIFDTHKTALKLGVFLLFLSGYLPNTAIASPALKPPTLLIETGAHQGRVGASATDRNRTMLATASEDGTVRLWTMPTLRLKAILRSPPTEFLNDAKFLAVSPNGRFVAVANSYRGFVYDTQSMQIVRKIVSPRIAALAISPDNSLIAYGLADGSCTLAVERLIDGHLIKRWCNFVPENDGVESTGLTYAPNGLLARADNREIEIYDKSLRIIGTLPFPDKKYDNASLDFDRATKLLAVARDGDNPILIYDFVAKRLVPFDNRGFYGAASSVMWSSDGTKLFGSGLMSETAKVGFSSPIYVWNRRDMSFGGVAAAGLFPQGPVYNIGKTLVYTEFFSSITAYDGAHVIAKGNVSPPEINLAQNPQAMQDYFGVSTDGTKVQWAISDRGTTALKSFLSFDVANLAAETASKPFDTLANWTDHAPGIVVSGYAKRDYDLRINGLHTFSTICVASGCRLMPFKIMDSPAVVAASDGLAVVGSPGVQMFDTKGVGSWFRGYWDIPSVSRVNLSSDHRIVVVALRNGTIKWLNAKNGKDLLTAFVDPTNTNKWIVFTPSGYYAAGLSAEDFAGWEIDRGPGKTPDFFPLSRFRAHFYRPDIIRLILSTLDEPKAVMLADAAARRVEDARPLTDRLPPVVHFIGLTDHPHVASGSTSLTYSLRSPSGRPVDHISVLVNGRPVKEIGLPTRKEGADADVTRSLSLTLTQRNSDVGLIAWSGDVASEPARATFVWDGAPAATAQARKLHALVVGVSAYADPDMTLAFAAKDARDFAKALEDQKGGYYADVETRVLVDHDVTRASLVDGLEWLEKSATDPDDVSVLYLAGHGITDAKQMYWFFPSDANADSVRAKGVSQDEIRRSLQSLSGKVIWFLDTCHAGGAAKRSPVDMNVLVNTVTSSENGGIVVFAASKGHQASLERPEWGNGAFTKAIVEGIGLGKADLLGKGFVTTSSLDTFIESRVNDLTEGAQNPVMERPPEEPDFAIAKVATRH